MGIMEKIRCFLLREKDFSQCGCKSPLVKRITVFGEKITISVDPYHPDWCPDCLAKMAIRCAWCGRSILPGDPITLYTPTVKWKSPGYAVVYQKNPLQVVGCLRWDCADTGADRAGFWVSPGKVQRVLSPMEKLYQEQGAGVVIEEDVSDISKATPI